MDKASYPMGKASYPLPDDVDETIRLLNAARIWNLSLVEWQGHILILDGDQVYYTADTMGEVAAYLAACFAETYVGPSLATIRAEIAAGRFADIDYDAAYALIEQDRRPRQGSGG
jgi:hypothetical protein